MTAVAIGLVLVLAVVAVSGALSRRTTRRRIDAVSERLDAPGPVVDRPGAFETSLSRLERGAETMALRVDRARADAHRALRAMELLPQGVVVCDESGIEVFRNGVAQAFSGARHAEALVERAVHEAMVSAVAGEPQRREVDVLGPPRRMLVVTALPLAVGDRPRGAVALIDDVSDRRRLEAVRRDFVANISHELKTPVGALGLLAETIAAEDDLPVMQRLAGRMTGEALRVGRIIDDLLALSRIEVEEDPVREPVGVHGLVEEAIDRMRSVADAHGITIATSGVGRRDTINGDRRQLVSAMSNLLENACKYSEEGSSVRVASRTDNQWVEISVRDEGIGIPGSDLERVFERFYRVDRARSRDTGGTGLGLAIVRHVVGNHHGDVRVTSREGEGSTFTLRLPTATG